MDIGDTSKFRYDDNLDQYFRRRYRKMLCELLEKIKIKPATLYDFLDSDEIPTHMCKELLNELEMLCDECFELSEKIEIPFNFLQTVKDCIKDYKKFIDEEEDCIKDYKKFIDEAEIPFGFPQTAKGCIKGYKKLVDETEEKYRQYCTKELRKASFKGCRMWKGQTPDILADAGFFHTAGVGLQCYKCKIVTNKRNLGSYPFKEHGRISPKCSHVKMKESTISLVEGQRTDIDIERTYFRVKLSTHQIEHWIEGNNAFAFTCEVEDNNVTVHWFCKDELVVPSNKHLIRNVKKKHTLLIEDFDPSDISDYTVVISANSCSQKLQFDVSCSPGYLWQKLGYGSAQKPSTTQAYTYPVSDADTFDKHKKNWLYMEQTTCGKVSLPMETLNSTVKGQAIQSSINHLNLKSNNNHDNLFTFNPSIPQSTNGCSHRLWYYQFNQTPGFLTEVLTHDLTVFRVRTFQTNYLSQTSVGLSMHLCNGEFRQSDVEDLCELVIF